MLQQVFYYIILIGNNVRNNLFLFAVDEKLHDFAEVARKHGINLSVILNFDEFEQAIKEHVLAHLLSIIRILRSCSYSGSLGALSGVSGLKLRLSIKA